MISTEEWTKRNRLAKGLSQADLAEAADLSRETIGKVERGQTIPDALTQAKLENTFGVKFPGLIETLPGARATPSNERVPDLQQVIHSLFPDESNDAALIRAALVVFRSLDAGTKQGMVEIADTENPDTAVRMLNQIWPAKLLRAAGELDDESIDALIAYARRALPPLSSEGSEGAARPASDNHTNT